MDLEPAMAPDGTFLVFASNRPAMPGGPALDGNYEGHSQPGRGGNLWRVDRTADGWAPPRRLPDAINAGASVYAPAVAADGSVYFMQPDAVTIVDQMGVAISGTYRMIPARIGNPLSPSDCP